MIGECVDQIGDPTKHPHPKREWPPSHQVKNHTIYHGWRTKGHGNSENFTLYHSENKFDDGHMPYPLYYATDQRMEAASQIGRIDGGPTGYHFHNFFESEKHIHQKYLTYGHAWHTAWDMPLWELHEDLTLGVQCARGRYDKAMPFEKIPGSQMPIYYMKELNRLARHRKWMKIVHDEESWWNTQKAKHPQKDVVANTDEATEKAVIVDDVQQENDEAADDGYDDDSYGDDDENESHPHVYKWEDLKQVYQEGHGTFFFGPHSHQIDIPADAKYEPVL